MYHSVTPNAVRNWGPWRFAITPQQFKNHLDYITRWHEPIMLDSILNDSAVPENGVVITFDDGFQDTLTTALPILEAHDIPATIYVTTGFLPDHCVPFEYGVAESLRTADWVNVSVGGLQLERALPTDEKVVRAYDEIKKWGMHVEREDRYELLSQLPNTDDAVDMLTEADVAELATHPLITVGAHGHEHLPLTTRGEGAVRADIKQCLKQLESLMDRSVDHFSYPYGAFDENVTSILKEFSFKTAASTHPADFVLDLDRQYPYEIPRFDASNGLNDII